MKGEDIFHISLTIFHWPSTDWIEPWPDQKNDRWEMETEIWKMFLPITSHLLSSPPFHMKVSADLLKDHKA